MSDKKYNATLTVAFPNDKFGEGALLSAELKAEDIANVTPGSKILIKKSKKQSVNGRSYFYVEILPPFGDSKAAATADDSEV